MHSIRVPTPASYLPRLDSISNPPNNSHLGTISSIPTAFPLLWLTKPHCGLTQICSRASLSLLPLLFEIYPAASYTLANVASKSPNSGYLLLTTPRTTFLLCGRYCKGSNPPARSVSNSR